MRIDHDAIIVLRTAPAIDTGTPNTIDVIQLASSALTLNRCGSSSAASDRLSVALRLQRDLTQQRVVDLVDIRQPRVHRSAAATLRSVGHSNWAALSTIMYLSNANRTDGWGQVDLPARRRRDTMRVWLSRHLKVHKLEPLPASEVLEDLRPHGGRWTATSGHSTDHGYVLVITDHEPPGVSSTCASQFETPLADPPR